MCVCGGGEERGSGGLYEGLCALCGCIEAWSQRRISARNGTHGRSALRSAPPTLAQLPPKTSEPPFHAPCTTWYMPSMMGQDKPRRCASLKADSAVGTPSATACVRAVRARGGEAVWMGSSDRERRTRTANRAAGGRGAREAAARKGARERPAPAVRPFLRSCSSRPNPNAPWSRPLCPPASRRARCAGRRCGCGTGRLRVCADSAVEGGRDGESR